MIYTTNAIESANARVRWIIENRGHFPSDEAATRRISLALHNISADWGRAANHWKTAMNQFAILYEERFAKGIGSIIRAAARGHVGRACVLGTPEYGIVLNDSDAEGNSR